MSNIHDELNRVLLRSRWIRWSLRNYQPGFYTLPEGKHVKLSKRLSKAKPTYEQRHADDPGEMEAP